ncbi:hypothetical protein AM500_21335 [Bacillus sp. FJAT-18017]|uniref:hypothetical protein n=1 Tax=Bacillus sp. FJAT-18017 TaxID=1705566 RepID=UPI0006AE595B|nr:hypothetical protein [Bacillus sp. FJAT-18017]ALC92053.1 hypothetical protein AM500_21335 [Bacillus sp. FJAT-18017]
MDNNGGKPFIQKAKDILECSVDGGVSVVSEIFLEGVVGAVVPGFTSFVLNYKQQRMEANLLRLFYELSLRIEEIERNYRALGERQKRTIKDFFAGLICDYVIDEQEADKIEYIANGFVNLTATENPEPTTIIIYLDILKNLRKIDLRLLFHKLHRPHFTHLELKEYLLKEGISEDIYHRTNEKLQRQGLLVSSLDEDYNKLVKTVNDLVDYVNALEDQRRRYLPRRSIGFHSKVWESDSLYISDLGNDFIQFFTNNK